MAATGMADLKSGRTPAPRLPQAEQTKRPSISDNLASSGQWSAMIRHRMAAPIVGAIDHDAAHAHLAISPNVILWGRMATSKRATRGWQISVLAARNGGELLLVVVVEIA
jgi:hypothetical protein